MNERVIELEGFLFGRCDRSPPWAVDTRPFCQPFGIRQSIVDPKPVSSFLFLPRLVEMSEFLAFERSPFPVVRGVPVKFFEDAVGDLFDEHVLCLDQFFVK